MSFSGDIRDSINNKCMSINAERPVVGSVKEQVIKAAGYDVPIRIYTPEQGDSFPLILFIHGGGWVACNLETHDNLARYLCKNVGAVVLSVGYTNAPEAKFPVPLEQCYDSLLWAISHSQDINTNGNIAVLGDSAGGNLSAALCLMAADRQGPKIDFQVLINPSLDLRCLLPQGKALIELQYQVIQYVVSAKDVYNPYVSPLLAEDLTGLPPALILLAEFDLLREEGQLYADKLSTFKVPVKVFCQKGAPHLAGNAARASKAAKESLDVAVAELRKFLV
jgi:acetyl esterase